MVEISDETMTSNIKAHKENGCCSVARKELWDITLEQ